MKRFLALIFIILIISFNLSCLIFADDDNSLPPEMEREAYSSGDVDLSKYNEKLDDVKDEAYSYVIPLISLSAIFVAAMFIVSPMNPRMKDSAKAALVGIMVGVILLLFYNEIGGFIEDITGVKFSSGSVTPTQQISD